MTAAAPSPGRLLAVALGAGDIEARAAAIGRIDDLDTLRRLAGLSVEAPPEAPSERRPEHPPDLPRALQRAAQDRLAERIDSGSVDLSSLCDPSRIEALVLDGVSSRLRQIAAQSISDPAELRAMLRQLRGKDKSVYKIIRQKCDALRAEDQRVVQIRHEVTAACESLERHAHRVHDAIYEPTFRHFQSRWEALEPQAPPDIRERAAAAIGRCREILAAHAAQLARRAAAASAQAAREAAREQEAARAEAASRQRQEAAEREAAEAALRREAEEKLRAERAADEALALRQIGGLIGKAQGALREGNTARAAGLRRTVEDKLAAAPAVAAHLAKQVQKLDAALNDLKEWKEHAAAPKRAELIAEMQALVGSAEAPQALADRIKQLQEDWKTVSKGLVIDSEADWQRFRQASIAAYQPCREYFEACAKLRAANAEKRRGVLDRLRAFETAQSGEHPDWSAIVAVLREAPQEWRRHSPVERAAIRALEEEFDAAMSRLGERLEAWHAGNAADKQSLIRLARQLSAKEGGRESVDAIKRLQLRWKELGPARRDQEKALWAEFRAQCDAVFQRREQVHAKHAAQLDAGKAHAIALCEEIERAADLEGPALEESSSRIPAWRAAFESLGELPRAERRPITDRLERALRRLEAAVSQGRLREERRSIADFFEAARRVHAYGWAVAQGADPEDRDASRRDAEASVAAVGRWPKGGAAALSEALAKAGKAPGEGADKFDAAAHEQALRLLCVRREILADRATPAEDLELRRTYQMERLVRRTGQGAETRPDEADALALEWIRVRPVSAQTHDALLERFLRSHLEPDARASSDGRRAADSGEFGPPSRR